jgi:hypothetical protein
MLHRPNSGSRIVVLACIAGTALWGCSSESSQQARARLPATLDSALINEKRALPAYGVADSAYYMIVEYKTFDKGRYSARAYVDFYFLRKARVKLATKYRHNRQTETWERFDEEWRIMHDTAQIR